MCQAGASASAALLNLKASSRFQALAVFQGLAKGAQGRAANPYDFFLVWFDFVVCRTVCLLHSMLGRPSLTPEELGRSRSKPRPACFATFAQSGGRRTEGQAWKQRPRCAKAAPREIFGERVCRTCLCLTVALAPCFSRGYGVPSDAPGRRPLLCSACAGFSFTTTWC